VKSHIIRSINDVAHLLNMKTVAKHVENADLVKDLGELGVDYAQGRALKKPVPVKCLENPADSHATAG